MLHFAKAKPIPFKPPVLSREEASVARSFADAAKRLGNELNPAAVRDAMGDDEVLAAVLREPMDSFSSGISRLADDFSGALTSGGRAAAVQIRTAGFPSSGSVDYSFNRLDPRSIAFAREQAGALITEVTGKDRAILQQVLVDGVRQGKAPKSLAADLRDTLTLTSRQAASTQAVYEGTRAALLEQGSTISAAEAGAERARDKAYERALRARSETIARTEISRAQNAGTFLGWQQAIETGFASPDSRKRWMADGSSPCDVCAPVDNSIVQWDEPFDNGVMMPPAHPNCKCNANLLPPGPPKPPEEPEVEVPIAGIEADPTFDRIYEAAQRAGKETAEGGYAGRRDAYNAYKQEVDEIIEVRLKEASETMTQEDLGVYEASLRYRMDGDMISAVDYYEATEEQRQAIVDFAEAARRDATPMIAMNEDAARGMLQDGRYRTQFETGTSGGTVNLEARAAAEGAMFQTPGSAAVETRTVYGYASAGDPLSTGVSTYGEIRVELSPAVRDRTTITLGDSLGRAPRPLPLGEAVTDRSAFGAIGNSYSEGLLTSSDPVAGRVSSFVRDAYIETQTQGGVSLSDIEAVYIPARMEAVAREFADAGIRVVR